MKKILASGPARNNMKGLEGVFPIKNIKGEWIAIVKKDEQSGEHVVLSVKKMTSDEIFAMFEDKNI